MATGLAPPDRFGERRAPFRTRTSALFAAEGRTAVVLRRGPILHHHLLKWDLRNDTFECGQWMKGTVGLYDLNADGSKLIYWARQWHRSAPTHGDEGEGQAIADGYEPLDATRRNYRSRRGRHAGRRYPDPLLAGEVKKKGLRPRRNEGVWTAVSTPPYFSAFAIWPSFGHWTGGGFFKDNRTLILQEDARGLIPKVNIRLPDDLRMATPFAFGAEAYPNAVGLATRGTAPDHRTRRFDDHALALYEAGVRWVDWFHIAGRDLLFAADGQIFRLAGHARVPLPQILDAAVCLIDLRPMTFQLVKAPLAALTWRPSPPRPHQPRR